MSASELRHYVRVYDDRLDDAMCKRMMESFHSLDRFHKPGGAAISAGLAQSAWTELDVTRLADSAFLGYFSKAVETALADYNRDVGLAIPVPDTRKISGLVMKRYVAGGEQGFQLHFDSIYHVSNRYLALLWYLNDVTEGGETVFPGLNLVIPARAGRLLVFPPYWMYQHAGRPPLSNDKYIVSTYLVF